MAEVIHVQTDQEDHFTTGSNEPKVSNTNNYVPITSVDKYKFMDDSYYGTGGYRDGTYLIAHTREAFYDTRRDFSVYKNLIAPIVNALVDPVFSEEAPRVITDVTGSTDDGAPIAREFLEDVDGAGTTMQEFVHVSTMKARLHGVTFTLVDNFPLESMQYAPTVQDSIDQRVYPYAIRKQAWEVVVAKTNDTGRLTEIWFSEPSRKDDNGTYERARCWTDMYSVIMERNRKSSDEDGKWHEAEPRIVHGLGEIPVVCTYGMSRATNHDVLPDPPLYDVARLNNLIYQKDSEIRDLERSSSFPVMYLQSDVGGNITLSSHNAILLPPGTTVTPGFISPDPGILNNLVETNKYFLEDLFRSAEQSGVHAVQTSAAASGVALAWRFWGIENQLKKTAKIATVTEQQIMYILSLYTGEQYEYTVDYPTTYQPGDRMQEITNLKSVIDMDPPKALKREVFKKVAKLLMSENTDEEQQGVIDEIEAEYEEEQEPEPTPVVQNVTLPDDEVQPMPPQGEEITEGL